MSALSLLRLAVSLAAAALAFSAPVAGVAQERAQERAQEPPPAPAPGDMARAQLEVAAKARVFLAERLGVPAEQLTDQTDLVRDLGLDRSDVYLAVTDLLAENGIDKPSDAQRQLTVVGLIIKSMTQARRSWFSKALRGEDFFIQPVLFATDRAPTGQAAPESVFGDKRAPGGVVSYGRAEVNIPKSHVTGQIERPWLDSVSLQDARSHIFVRKLEAVDAAAFFATASEESEQDILVYIHGFNVSFADSLLRAGQIAYDFEFKGTMMAFTWPAYRSTTAYTTQWENALWSSRHVEAFLEQLSASARESGRKLHVIAHSMGNKALLGALRNLALRGVNEPMFQSVLLCAPDFDAGMFREQVAEEIKPLSRQWVVYASDNDLALITSERLTTLRLGKPVTPAEGFEIIDASKVEVTPWSLPETHSYYAVKKPVIDDMKGVLKGLVADVRGLVSKPNPDGAVWTFKGE